jgi:hypothetical protein
MLAGQVGKKLRVEPTAPGATGYEWRAAPGDALTLVEKTSDVSRASVGASSRDSFTFVPGKAGIFTISFDLVRPWAPDDVAGHEDYEVVVKG